MIVEIHHNISVSFYAIKIFVKLNEIIIVCSYETVKEIKYIL